MITARFRRVKAVFGDALDVEPSERAAFVEQACAGDAELGSEVRRLLGIRQEATRRSWLRLPTVLRGSTVSSAGGGGHFAETSSGAEGTAGAAAGMPGTGATIAGRYLLGARLGAGAFGAVFRATDRIASEDVAVKLVALASDFQERAYRKEVAALRHLRLPGVVELLDEGEDLGFPFLVMRLVAGTPFPGDDVRPGDWRTVLLRGAALAEAMDRLHAAGVYHRDLKPANVLVGADGRLTIVDLGISEDETDADRWTAEGPVAGTPMYMAPERLRGERATRATDLYAVGAMLYEGVSGRHPWGDGGHLSLLAAARGAAPSPVGSLAPDLPAAAAELIDALVAPDAAKRPADAARLLRGILAPLDGRPRIELPRLGGDALVARLVACCRQGVAADVTGRPGAGKSRLVADAARRLAEEGFLVRHVLPADEPLAALRALAPASARDPSLTTEGVERALRAHLAARLREGLVLVADDFARLDEASRGILAGLRREGAVVRVLTDGDADARGRDAADGIGERIDLAFLGEADVASLVDAPERLFHLRADAARLLWRRTRGSPRALLRQVESWTAMGLATWDGARLAVGPGALRRLRAAPSWPAADPEESAGLDDAAREVWDAATFARAPLLPAELAQVVGQPAWRVERCVRDLAARALVDLDEAGAVVPLGPGSGSTALTPERRREWSDAIARHLPPDSEERVEHLGAAERHEEACRAGLDLARRSLAAGRPAEAASCLESALARARRHAPQCPGLYAEILGAMADAAVSSATRHAIDVALYHAGLAPDRDVLVRSWTTLLQAAAACLRAAPQRALSLLDSKDGMPTEAHARVAHVVRYTASAQVSPAERRRAVVRAAPWVRRRADRDARALYASWLGWLRYHEGRFEAAMRLHDRAAQRARRGRARVTALCNAAMSAIEAGRLDDARDRGAAAVRAATEARDVVNEARAEMLLRQVRYRMCEDAGPDEDLVSASAALDTGSVRGQIVLGEAAAAWRARRVVRAGELASMAAGVLGGAAQPAATRLGTALAAVCGRDGTEIVAAGLVPAPSGATAGPPGIEAQITALAAEALGCDAVPREARDAAVAWAARAPRATERREVLSPAEVMSRLAPGGG